MMKIIKIFGASMSIPLSLQKEKNPKSVPLKISRTVENDIIETTYI